MWETIKNDPILKTVAVIVLSVLGFGFAFNIMFGPRNNGMDGGMHMGGGYSLENTLSYILSIGVKLLLIAIILAAIVTVFRFVKSGINQGSENSVAQNTKDYPGQSVSSRVKQNNQPGLKVVSMVGISIVTFGLIILLFTSIFRTNVVYGMSGNGMMGFQPTGYGLTDVLSFMLKLLLFVSIAGVIIGVIMYVKENYSKQITESIGMFIMKDNHAVNCPNCQAKISDESKYCPYCGEKLKQECAACGLEIKTEWKCCPGCGAEKV